MPQKSPEFTNNASLIVKYLNTANQFLMNHFLAITLVPILSAIALKTLQLGPAEILNLCNSFYSDFTQIINSCFLIIFILFTLHFMSKPRPVYLIDYACFKPPFNFRVPSATFVEHIIENLHMEPKSVAFQMKILERSGLGEETSLPHKIHYIPPVVTIEDSREEAEMVIFSAMDILLKKTGLNPNDIDILIVNCSLFSPTPSLSSMVINKYKMRSNVKSFNLSGMGCSAGLISVDLARSLLQVHPNSTVVIITTEIMSPNYYEGKERSMLLPNCLFRMGGAAVLLSNRGSDKSRSKYQLRHLVRTHIGSEDKAYRCIFQEPDPQGKIGISLSKDLMVIAGEALKSNITAIGPLILPLSEQIRFFVSLLGRKVFGSKLVKPYMPDFKRAVEHFCIHAGGRAVIDEIQKRLDLSAENIEGSRMTLHRFGNTSSSSLWYELSYIEAKGRMKKGDRVLMIAFGSGFKCNSAAWICNRSADEEDADSAWYDSIHRYPAHIPEVVKL